MNKSKIVTNMLASISESVDDSWIEKLDLKKLSKLLSDKISSIIDMKVNIKLELKQSRGRYKIDMISNNFADKMKPKMFKKLFVEDFGGNATKDGYYWLPVHYLYYNFSGGSNGCSIADIYIDKDGKIYKINTAY